MEKLSGPGEAWSLKMSRLLYADRYRTSGLKTAWPHVHDTRRFKKATRQTGKISSSRRHRLTWILLLVRSKTLNCFIWMHCIRR
ncbi:hypothetical protein RRG08_050119 [Elysia crispata]|uniref:Uncharacterized protein n=1 Tax=Elysia crispata TaxID=231223 RepID=A0AAE0Z5Z9_9GAST|nr:hypothetical protein RRG08_050119 [Elysia crispata]